MNGFFIDKMNIVQDHSGSARLPLIGRDGLWRFDLQTGVFNPEPFVKDLKLEGSYSTSLMISCNGSRVSVYGNPSRYGRIDNLYGLQTIQECVNVYNEVLQKLGLPIFTECTEYLYFQNKGGKATKTANGAIIKHLDFTRNLATGFNNERPFLKGLSTQSIYKSVSPHLYQDENTVEWFGANVQKNGSTRRYIKVYNKTSDLLRHQKKINRSISDDSDFDYYENLIQFTLLNGIVREEHSFKRVFLQENNLFAYGLFNESDFHTHLTCINEIRTRLEVTKMKYETIADNLLNEGVCKSRQSANATQMYYSMWLHGEYIDKTKRQYFEHRKRLLQIGIDISQKLDITRAPLRLKEAEIITVSVIDAPEWYRHPVKPNPLRLVA